MTKDALAIGERQAAEVPADAGALEERIAAGLRALIGLQKTDGH